MRYFVRLQNSIRGPLEAAELVLLPGIDRRSLVCPEAGDPKNRKNWKTARSFPDLLPLLLEPRVAEKFAEALERFSEDVKATLPPQAAQAIEAAVDRLPAGTWWGLAGLAVFLGVLAVRTPGTARRSLLAPEPPPQLAPVELAKAVTLPGCGGRLGEASGVRPPSAARSGADSYDLSWYDGPSGQAIEVRYDHETREFRPLNDASKAVFRYGAACR
ncbi:MAG: hypothetical protein HYZ75_18680 [Elusimicrobia bacterium]|nr:hypothetical protein [Elusimicrobiota bacterium]